MQFRTCPVMIDAERLLWENWSAVCELMHDDMPPSGGRARGLAPKEAAELFPDAGVDIDTGDPLIYALIPTADGDMLVTEGDWIIRGVDGDLYACPNDLFKTTYEVVENGL